MAARHRRVRVPAFSALIRRLTGSAGYGVACFEIAVGTEEPQQHKSASLI